MNKRAVVSFVLAISALFVLNGSAVTFADNSTKLSVDVSEAVLQLTVPQSASIELNPTSSSAVFGSTNLTLNVATNNITGYRIMMFVSTTDLTHNILSNTVIPTLPAASTEANFPANAWGYKVIGDVYRPILVSNVPDSWIIETPTNGTNHTMSLAAKVDGSKPSGDYTSILTFQAVANPNALKDTIVFDGNGADSGTMSDQLVYQGEPTKLNANVFTKDGYLFNGWNTDPYGSRVGYGDEDMYTAKNASTSSTTTLYARWILDTGQGSGYRGKTLQDAYEMAYVSNPGQFAKDGGGTKHGLYVPHKTNGEYDGTYFEATQQSDYDGIPANDLRFAMQDIDMMIDGVKICDYATVVGSGAYVLDLRDFKSYHIAKLTDGRCWLQDNLVLDLSDTTIRSKITPDTTNASSEALGYLFNGGGTGRFAAEAVSDVEKLSHDELMWTGYSYYRPRLYKGIADNVSNDTIDQAEGWKKGYYYNFCAASAGSFCYGSGYGNDAMPGNPVPREDTAIDAEYDICPKGWRLPTSGADGGEYEVLMGSSDYAGTTEQYGNFVYALHFPIAGVYNRTDMMGADTSGNIWSSTYNNAYNMYVAYRHFNSAPQTNARGSRVNQINVRCIAK